MAKIDRQINFDIQSMGMRINEHYRKQKVRKQKNVKESGSQSGSERWVERRRETEP